MPEADIVSFPYAENGLDIYGSALVARADWLAAHGETAKKFVRASIGGLRMLIADPTGGMAALKKCEALFDEPLEARRWAMTRDRSIITPNVRAGGFGVVDLARAQTLITANAEAYGIANPPTAAGLWTDQYLPPLADRTV